MPNYTFTICTATYNRQHTLPAVYESLRAQTFTDFEWVIVDDGSTDGTGELVKQWMKAAKFPIRYFYQTNRGKHFASNRGVREAEGELLLFFDSDDRCVPETLARFKFHWDSIPRSDRSSFSTVTGLCQREDGSPVGPGFPAPVLDVSAPGEQMKHRRLAERWGVNRTDILKTFPFPEIPGEKYLAEGIVWTRVSLLYRTRFINERLRIVRLLENGLTLSSAQVRVNNAIGARLCYKESLHPELPTIWRIRDAINYCRFSFHAGLGWGRLVAESEHALLTSAASPAGFLAYYLDRRQYRFPAWIDRLQHRLP